MPKALFGREKMKQVRVRKLLSPGRLPGRPQGEVRASDPGSIDGRDNTLKSLAVGRSQV